MKKIMLLLTILMIMLNAGVAYGTEEVSVIVDGKHVVSDTPAVITPSGSTMLPFRSIFNALGVGDDSIQWNPSSKSIEVRSESKYIFLIIGNSGALINDSFITLNAAPYIESGRTYVPVRFVSEALGASVKWDKVSRTVTITSNN